MKRLTALFLSLALILTMSGCGSSSATEQTQPAETEAAADADAVEVLEKPDLKSIEPADSFAGGSGTADDPYQIENAAQLALLSKLCGEEDVTNNSYSKAGYILTADIALNDTANVSEWGTTPPETQWIPIGEAFRFQGVFDGNGHTISGMYIFTDLSNSGSNHGDPGSYPGLFGSVSGAEIRDVSLADSRIIATGRVTSVGGIASDVYDSVIRGCNSSVTIELYAGTNAGGIAGRFQKGTMDGCSFDGEILISPNSTAGGIVGHAAEFDEILSCINQGEIRASVAGDTGAYAGGITGTLDPGEDSVIRGCVNKGSVSATEAKAGGIAGTISYSKVIDPGTYQPSASAHLTAEACENQGSVVSEAGTAGGITGMLFNTSNKVGDTVGDMSVKLLSCVNSGSVRAAGKAGGITGECSTVAAWSFIKCSNTGTVESSAETAGGIAAGIAPAAAPTNFDNCVNEGSVYSGTGSAGGIAGSMFGFTQYVDASEAQTTYFNECTNRGEISGADSAKGLGGILGEIISSRSTVSIRLCTNEGTVKGGKSCRVGGILGSSAFSNLAQFTGPTFEIVGCNNTGILTQGDGSVEFNKSLTGAGDLTEEDRAKTNLEAAAIQIEGGSAVGGLVGYCKQGIVSQSSSNGKIFLAANAQPAFGYEDLAAASSSENDSRQLIFCGGICGMYFYLADNGSTEENTGMRDCSYGGGVPIAAYVAFESTGISNVIETE